MVSNSADTNQAAIDNTTHTLVMFYGMLNLPKLAQILPIEGVDEYDYKACLEHLKARSVAVKCMGWTRVFGTHHASI